MKTAVITRHAISNYGSLLQALATQQVLTDLGHECKIIDYIRADENYHNFEKTLLARKPGWNNNPIKRLVYLALRQGPCVSAGKRFELARSQYLSTTKLYTSLQELENDKPQADIYITGSDQVWGPVANGSYDSAYCLSFTSPEDKRISYAASFGHTDMTTELERYFTEQLSRYDKLAVREDSAVEMLRKMGLSACQVIDPTLLLDRDYWGRYLRPIKHKNYILIYQLHSDKRLGAYAKRVAKELGCRLIRVSASFHQISREGKLIYAPDPGSFLSYIRNARCMITDSFHGTAFAINFNTPFVEVLPNTNTGTRNMSILRLTGLEDRVLRDIDDTSLAGADIDFTHANEVIAQKRRESLDILREMLEA